jgi:hypothetical protein
VGSITQFDFCAVTSDICKAALAINVPVINVVVEELRRWPLLENARAWSKL